MKVFVILRRIHTSFIRFNMEGRLDYRNKVILAPMVRIGTLPMRLLTLEYGADIVYTEELIDWKLMRSVRRVNDVLGTVDFVDKTDGTIVFRTCAKEKNHVVLQLGTCDPDRALAVAKKVEHDVAGIDINMGCPKSFSVKGGMGAALMSPHPPRLACCILRTLVQELRVPVSCKVRVFPSVDETVRLCKELVATGIAAIAVHGRTKEERPRNPVRVESIRAVAAAVDVPVIANGGSSQIRTYPDMMSFRDDCGASSVMVARAASRSPGIFLSAGGHTSPPTAEAGDQYIIQYLRLAVQYDNAPANTKYCVQTILGDRQATSEEGRQLAASQTLEQICSVWNLGDYCRTKQREFQSQGLLGRRQVCPTYLANALDDLHPSTTKRLRAQDAHVDTETNTPIIDTNHKQYLANTTTTSNDINKQLNQKESHLNNGSEAEQIEEDQLKITTKSAIYNSPISNSKQTELLNIHCLLINTELDERTITSDEVVFEKNPETLRMSAEDTSCFPLKNIEQKNVSNDNISNKSNLELKNLVNKSNVNSRLLCTQINNSIMDLKNKINESDPGFSFDNINEEIHHSKNNSTGCTENIISLIKDKTFVHEKNNANRSLIGSSIKNINTDLAPNSNLLLKTAINKTRLCDSTKNTRTEVRLLSDQETEIISESNWNSSKDLSLDSEVIELRCAFIRASFTRDTDLPKTRLCLWCARNGMETPIYRTEQREKLFQSVVTVGDRKYTSSYWEKNKRFAEQGAALVCLNALGVVDLETLVKLGSVL